MSEFNGLTRSDRDAIAASSRTAPLDALRRSGRHRVLLAKATSFINPDAGWIIGRTGKPPTHGECTNSHEENGQFNNYYTKLSVLYSSAFSPGNPAVGNFFRCSPSLAAGIVLAHDATAKLLTVNLFPRIRITYGAAWAPGNPAVGATITVTSTIRTGAFTATGLVLAHDTSAKKIDIALTNGATFVSGDTLSDGTNTYTLNTSSVSITGSNVYSVASLKYHGASGDFLASGVFVGMHLTVAGYTAHTAANNIVATVSTVTATDILPTQVLVNEGVVATAVTFDAVVDTIGNPTCTCVGQVLVSSVAATGSWTPGDRIGGTTGVASYPPVAPVSVMGTLVEYVTATKTATIVPDTGQEFFALMNLVNLSSGGIITNSPGAITSATWDTITSGANSIALAKGVAIMEDTFGSLAIPNDPKKPTVRPAEMGQHWPTGSPGAEQQFRTEAFLIGTQVGSWNIGDAFTAVDATGTTTGIVSLIPSGTAVVGVPPAGSLSFSGGFRAGMVVTNNTTGGSIVLTAANWGNAGVNYGWMPASFRKTNSTIARGDDYTDTGSGINDWRRFVALRKGMLGRRGGSVICRFIGQIKSTLPASESNLLEVIVIPDWRYASEFGGLRVIPADRKLGWQIPIPATVSQGGIFVLEFMVTGIHNLTQVWRGHFLLSTTINTVSIPYTQAPLVSMDLETIYRSWIGSNPAHQPELQDYNLGVNFRVDGTNGAGLVAPQPFGTVGASTIPQDGTRMACTIYEGECWYEPGY